MPYANLQPLRNKWWPQVRASPAGACVVQVEQEPVELALSVDRHAHAEQLCPWQSFERETAFVVGPGATWRPPLPPFCIALASTLQGRMLGEGRRARGSNRP